MNIKKVIFINLLGWTALLLFILWKNYESSNKAKAITNEIFQKEYNCVVLKKEKEINNHGFLKLVLFDFVKNENIDFDPIDISQGLILFRKVIVGDTLVKIRNNNVFVIQNGEKVDSVVFDVVVKHSR